MRYLILISFILFLQGCLITTYTVEKERVDLEATGNKGCIQGTCTPTVSKKKFSPIRKITVIGLEVGEHDPNAEVKDVGFENNDEESLLKTADLELNQEELQDQSLNNEMGKYVDPDYQMYTVKKSDSLQRISEKFYGTTKYWQKIYEFNKDVLKSPNVIFVGQKIKIPKEG